MAFTILYVTCSSQEEASRLSGGLLEKRLIACVNVFPIQSQFWWNGNLDRGQEWVALMKTQNKHIASVEEFINAKHSYQTPCIIRWEVDANQAYETWIISETEGGSLS